jgi:hypothetical protein
MKYWRRTGFNDAWSWEDLSSNDRVSSPLKRRLGRAMRYSLALRSPVQRNDTMILLLNIARYLRVLWIPSSTINASMTHTGFSSESHFSTRGSNVLGFEPPHR